MTTATMPSAEIVFDTMFAYQRSGALKAALDLDVFTAIHEGATSAPSLAARCGAAERGVRILCDYLTTIGLLTKPNGVYGLTPESAAFLSKKSPAYLGTTARFLLLPELKQNMDAVADAVRLGGVPPSNDNTVDGENPIWVEFARSMGPMMVPAAHGIADLVAGSGPLKVLDIAAGHGLFGITIAQRNPQAEIMAADWPSVLTVANEHARGAKVEGRYQNLAGDAFKVEFPGGFDIVLVTNFLHHFDPATCVSFLKKVHAALKPGGRVVVLEFVPNPDRVTPPIPARFSLAMLTGTASGDAYTFDELRQQLEGAGFRNVSAHGLPMPQTVLLAEK
jgi:2-polyprenyl-3-methyl-5-hydroxy-6-metoxy-1,4-benzoquinol methylase